MLLTTSCSGSECNNCCDQRAWVASAQIFTLLSHNRDHMAWSLYYCLLVPLTCGCYFSRTSCLWWIAHSTPLLLKGCNIMLWLPLSAQVSWQFEATATDRLVHGRFWSDQLVKKLLTLSVPAPVYIREEKLCTGTGSHIYTSWMKILVLWPWEPKQWAIFMAQVFLETGPSSDSLEPLIGFLLAYLEPQLWPTNQKLI